MTRQKKILCSVIATCLLANFVMPQAYADSAASLNIYAGPQSVSPRETIHVTLELTDARGNSLSDGNVELSYVSDGVVKTLAGIPTHGLISFDVQAQDSTGLMEFSAKTKGVTSKTAFVIVVATQPQPFSLKAKAGRQAETIKLTSDVFADKYGNPISELSLVSVDWIDDKGLKARQNTQLLNSRIVLTGKCPAKFHGTLKVQANLNSIQSVPIDISSYCELGRG